MSGTPIEAFTAYQEAKWAVDRAYEAANDAIYEQNSRGGEARLIVGTIATVVGVELSENIEGGDLWSEANMRRVMRAVKALARENRKLKGLPDAFH